MGQVLAKVTLRIANIISLFTSKGGSDKNRVCEKNIHSSYSKLNDYVVDEAKEIIQDSHIVSITQEDEGNETEVPIPRFHHVSTNSTNEIVEEKELVISIPDPPPLENVVRKETETRRKSNKVSLLEFVSKVAAPNGGVRESYADVVSKSKGSEQIKNKSTPKSITAAAQEGVNAKNVKEGKWKRHYCSSHKILLVGEGDFSFSTCLAEAFGSATNMVATSLDTLDFLKKNYANAISNISHLEKIGATVIHGVDATVMASDPRLEGLKFDRIIYNFPLAGFTDEAKRKQLSRNRNLVLRFMTNAKEMIKDGGEIHITHKTSAAYREWGLENLGKQVRLKLIEEVEFTLTHYKGYDTKYGFGGDENFNCYPSKTYKFGPKCELLPSHG